MSLPDSTLPPIGRAEKDFRESFERLKWGKPERMPKGTRVSQNNVAKEAGRDPSALRKARFPSLIAEIQRWVKENPVDAPLSRRQILLAKRRQNRDLRKTIQEVSAERDSLGSKLNAANAKIVELTDKVAELEAKLPPVNVTPLLGPPTKPNV
jgi:hypothetical protein